MDEYTIFTDYQKENGSYVEIGVNKDVRTLRIGTARYPNDTNPNWKFYYQPIFGDAEGVRFALAQMYAEGFKRADLLSEGE